MPARIVVCASGEGTGFESIVRASKEGRLNADVVGLIVNRSTAGAISRAERLRIPVTTLSLKSFPDRQKWDQAMTDQAALWGADLIALAGFLALIGPKFLERFPNRVVNVHPALLPRHGGEGMYGLAVHQSVLSSGDSETGVTIHLVDREFDRGRILEQKKIPVLKGDSAASLQARVKVLEGELYPKVLNDLIQTGLT